MPQTRNRGARFAEWVSTSLPFVLLIVPRDNKTPRQEFCEKSRNPEAEDGGKTKVAPCARHTICLLTISTSRRSPLIAHPSRSGLARIAPDQNPAGPPPAYFAVRSSCAPRVVL